MSESEAQYVVVVEYGGNSDPVRLYAVARRSTLLPSEGGPFVPEYNILERYDSYDEALQGALWRDQRDREIAGR